MSTDSEVGAQVAGLGSTTGAVMVIGAGIAGVQASLDLAESGYKVYLVEAKPAIGGHMAQLDKTFPTNDCAMCILSPKLVETGQRLNIELMPNTDVLELQGERGRFTATVRRRPRYVDPDKCISCGDCVAVCPITMPDRFNPGLAERKAIYCLYPQAVPSTYAIDKVGRAPCTDACPAGVSAQGYIALIRQRRYADALRLIRERIPFPSVCGRTCHHPCEGRCNRGLVDEPVAIQALKRFVTDRLYLGHVPAPVRVPRTRPQRIAIVGAGPAGLTAAQDLVKLGYGVTVFEALPEPGGMMRFGIPEYRLPKDVLRRDISDILALGVELCVNTPVSDASQLLADFDAVYLAVGVYGEHKLEVEGESLEGVVSAIAMLRDVNLGHFPSLGKRVAVVGGGITAVDAATTALRLGAKEVYLVFRRGRGEIPAYGWELDEAESEGVHFVQQAIPTRILGENGRVRGLEYADTQPGPRGPDGRPTMVPVAGTERVLWVDTVVRALGQSSDLWHLAKSPEAYLGEPETLATGTPGLFAGPGQVTGAGFIINAIAQGHQAATSIHRYLQGEPLVQSPGVKIPVAKWTRAEAEALVAQGEITPQPRLPRPLLPLRERIERFLEVEMGLTESMALAEADRCLDCGGCSECGACEIACQAGAIAHDQVAVEEQLEVGAVVLAPGFRVYPAGLSAEYGFGRYPNVVSSLQFERLLSASGPTLGHVTRPSDGKPATRIAFLQCVGSRDQNHDYCSSVCCMFATKEAIMAVEHEPSTQVHVFMMDMRSFSKGYDEYYRRARQKYGIHYTRCRISSVRERSHTQNLVIRYLPEGKPIAEDEFDLVVLSVGMEIPDSVRELGRRLGVELDHNGFCCTGRFSPLETSRPGVYAIGPFREPKDIPESVIEGSGAAAAAGELLSESRWSLTSETQYPPERDVSAEEPRVGVFVCHCGSNIGGYLDVPAVADYARGLPGVVHAEDNLYTCSQDSITHITEQVKALDLNRVVVAACTPLTHEPLFQDSLRAAGLNGFLFEMANIRNHCSWVHGGDWDNGTVKAKDLVRMAVARAAWLEPLYMTTVPVRKRTLVVGGGVAGLTAALSLAEQGIAVTLVEREAELGGNLRHLRYLVQLTNGGSTGVRCADDPQVLLRDLVERVAAEPLIDVCLETELVRTGGFQGNFVSVLRTPSGDVSVEHGATIVATGAQEYRGTDYGYGTDPRILSLLEFEQRLSEWGPDSPAVPKSVVMILCAGQPAEKYCSRICCTAALKNALVLKQLSPNAQVTVLYQDIRTFGFKERLYTEARRRGVLFVRYGFDHKPEVSVLDGVLTITACDPVLDQELVFRPDQLVLATPMVPAAEADTLASRLKVGVDLDGWFMEAHVKLRPVDFAARGLYVAGAAHYPKLLDETIVQAQAAAGRAMTLLSRDSIKVGGVVAQVDPGLCVGCLTCVRICPFDVPQISMDLTGVGGIVGAAVIEPAQCQGCGICVGECPARAIQLLHYRDQQMNAKIAVFNEAVKVPA